jgi:hypothetical protein
MRGRIHFPRGEIASYQRATLTRCTSGVGHLANAQVFAIRTEQGGERPTIMPDESSRSGQFAGGT